MVEFDLVDFEAAVPLGLVQETVGERTIGVLLGDEELHRFRVVKLGEPIQTQAQSPTRLRLRLGGLLRTVSTWRPASTCQAAGVSVAGVSECH